MRKSAFGDYWPPIPFRSAPSTPLPKPRIALINIMDNARGTERHFLRTIEAANPNASVTLCRMACAKKDHKYFSEQDYLIGENYVDWQDVIGHHYFDLVIVSGINRGTLSYEDLGKDYPDFWEESKILFETLRLLLHTKGIGHAALVCWSAFAAMKTLYGIEKGIHPQKFYGLFNHKLETPDHPLIQNIENRNILIPQSRSSFMKEEDLRTVIADRSGEVVMNGPDGPAIWTLEHGRMTCFINHLEYSLDTLAREYQRDKKIDANMAFPQNYDPENYDTAENREIFDQLSLACNQFYKNLIKLSLTPCQIAVQTEFYAGQGEGEMALAVG